MAGRHRAVRRRQTLPPGLRLLGPVVAALLGVIVTASPHASGGVSMSGRVPGMGKLDGATVDLDEDARQLRRQAARVRADQPRTTRSSRSALRTRWVRPVAGYVTSVYGMRWGALHPGLDIAAPYGTPVRSMTAGTVTSAGWAGGYGLMVIVRTEDGMDIFYPHLSALGVSAGQVSPGTVVGRIGSTGVSTGPHLHIEIRIGGVAVEPTRLLRAHGIDYE